MPTPIRRITAAQFGLLAQPAQLTRKIAAVHVHHTWRPPQLTPTESRAAWLSLAWQDWHSAT